MKDYLNKADNRAIDVKQQPPKRQTVERKTQKAADKHINTDVPHKIAEREKEQRHRPDEHEKDVENNDRGLSGRKRETQKFERAVEYCKKNAEGD